MNNRRGGNTDVNKAQACRSTGELGPSDGEGDGRGPEILACVFSWSYGIYRRVK